MRRKQNGTRPLNPIEIIAEKRAERRRLTALCASGELPWSALDLWHLEQDPNYEIPVRRADGTIVD